MHQMILHDFTSGGRKMALHNAVSLVTCLCHQILKFSPMGLCFPGATKPKDLDPELLCPLTQRLMGYFSKSDKVRSNIMFLLLCMVMCIIWRCRCILDWTLDSGSEGCGFDSRQCLALLSFSKTFFFSTHMYKWVPGRMRTSFVTWFGMCAPLKWCLARMLPKELRRCTMSAGLILNLVTRVIIHCKALWVVSHTRKVLYMVAQKERNTYDQWFQETRNKMKRHNCVLNSFPARWHPDH